MKTLTIPYGEYLEELRQERRDGFENAGRIVLDAIRQLTVVCDRSEAQLLLKDSFGADVGERILQAIDHNKEASINTDLNSLAPELLEQLEIYVAKFERDNPGWTAVAAKKLIKKARGEK